MNDFLSFEQNMQCLKMRSLPTIDVRARVMERINEKSRHVRKQPNRRVIFAAAAAIALVAAIPVSASIVPFKWHGMDFSIEQDGGKNKWVDTFKELIAGHENAVQWMEKGMRVSETLTPEETARSFPFSIIRPNASVMPLQRAVALKGPVISNGVKSTDQFTYSYWDHYKNGSQWVVVRQMLDEAATAFINHEHSSHTSSYADGYQSIQLSGDTVGFIAKRSHNEQLMWVTYWSAEQRKIIELQISGNVSQELLVQVANSYISK